MGMFCLRLGMFLKLNGWQGLKERLLWELLWNAQFVATRCLKLKSTCPVLWLHHIWYIWQHLHFRLVSEDSKRGAWVKGSVGKFNKRRQFSLVCNWQETLRCFIQHHRQCWWLPMASCWLGPAWEKSRNKLGLSCAKLRAKLNLTILVVFVWFVWFCLVGFIW